MRTLMTVGVVLAGLAGAARSEEAEKGAKGFDPAKIVGTWKLVSGSKYGEKVDVKTDSKDSIVFTKDDITIKEGDTDAHKMTYKLDTKAKPVAITMTGVLGPAKDMTAEGIIAVQGDELKICYSLPGEKRPTAFESPKDSKTLYFVLKRAK